MELLAAGRDCDVFDLGDGTVLRRKRDGGSLEREAAVLRHARAHGVPCPAVHRAEGPDLVLDLVAGPTQLHDLLSEPTVDHAAEGGRLLAEIHALVHAVPPMDADAGDGACLLHLDLHPGNVILSPDGPVVIDWVNATDGPAALDVADTWLVIAGIAGDADPVVRALLDAFLDAAGREEAGRHLPEAARRRLRDPHISDAERAAMQRVVSSNV